MAERQSRLHGEAQQMSQGDLLLQKGIWKKIITSEEAALVRVLNRYTELDKCLKCGGVLRSRPGVCHCHDYFCKMLS